ncbi:MAG: hypothetical protein AAFY60_08805, partial [Myxococcota bacterium]
MENRPAPSLLLRFTAACIGMALLLPVGTHQGEPLWPWQLAFDPSFVVASGVALVCAVTLFVLSGRVHRPVGGVATALGLLLFSLSVALLGQSDLFTAMGAARVYNLAPLALGVGLIAGADASASTLHPRRLFAARLAAGAGLLALLFYLASPTAYGTVVAEMSSHLRYALELGLTMQERVTATITEVLVVGLIAACVFVATGVMHGRPHGFERVVILLSALGFLVLADFARNALDDGWLGFLSAARAVSGWLAVTTLTVSCTATLVNGWELRRPRGRVPTWASVVALCAVIGLVLPDSPRRAPWELGVAPAWAEALYEDAVPALADARERKERRAASRIVLALAEPIPELQAA